MPNRVLFSVRYFSKLFMKYLKVSMSLVLFLTIIRFNVFFLSVSAWLTDSSFGEVFMSFFTGFRFDLLIYGFLLIPMLLLWIFFALTVTWGELSTLITRWYFRSTWAFIGFLQVFDFMQFHVNGVRIREQQFQSLFGGWIFEIWPSVSMVPFFVFLIVVLIVFFLGLWVIEQVQIGDWKDEYSPLKGGWGEISWRLFWPLLIVALMARGTLEAHHLRYEHSLISNDTRLNEMALNPMWTMDK